MISMDTVVKAQPKIESQSQLLFAPGQKHLAYLDSLRALAAIYVVFFHALIQIEPDGKTLTGKAKAFAVFFTFGHQAVDLFIVISGFCLMLPVIKNEGHLIGGVKTFFGKRAKRILPPYFIALGFTLFAIKTMVGHKTGTGWDVAIPVTLKGLITHFLLVQDVFSDTAEQINGAFWSISVEWRIYFVFPLLLFAWRRFGPLATTMIAILTSYGLLDLLSHSALNYNPNAMVGIMPQYLGLFALGMLGAALCHPTNPTLSKIRQRVPWMALMYGSLALVFILCKAKIYHGSHVPIAFSDLIVGIWAMSLLIAVSINGKGHIRRFLSWKPLAFVGTYAYSIYLIHGPLQQIIWQFALQPLHLRPLMIFIIQCTVGTLIIIGLSYGFFLFGERPFFRNQNYKKLLQSQPQK